MNVAFIPVRAGSKSILRKNIKSLFGRPLVYWVTKAASDTRKIDKVVVASDSEEILEVVRKFNLPKVECFIRGNESSTDTASTESAMLEYLTQSGLKKDDLFVLIQATSPLLETDNLSKGLELMNSASYDSLLSCVPNKRFFWNSDGKPVNYDFTRRSRRQDMKGMYMENGAFYINSVGNIFKDKNRLSGRIGIVEMPEYTALEIDEEDDWLVAESLMRRHKILSPISSEVKLFISDVDGVMTDAGMYYSNDGVESKKFNTRDGKGFEMLRESGILTAIITSENTRAVDDRAKKLKIDFLYQASLNKVEAVEEILRKTNLMWANVAYIGDDINDLEAIRKAGLSASPADGHEHNRAASGYVCSLKGGDGCVREFIEYILRTRS